MRELEEATRGLPFRLDTASGPVFLATALHRFAGGECGEWGDNQLRPTWGHPWEPGDEAAAA
jgi:hypothetical protein